LPTVPYKPYRDVTDWNDTTEEEALTSNKGGFFVYSAAKALAEKAAWVFVKEHPEVSLTTSTHADTFTKRLQNCELSSLPSTFRWPIRARSRHPTRGCRRAEHQYRATHHPQSGRHPWEPWIWVCRRSRRRGSTGCRHQDLRTSPCLNWRL